MKHNMIETIMGMVVLVIAGFFVVFAYSRSQLHPTNGYNLIAKFERIDGLAVGSDVRLSGVKIGSIINQIVDPKTYLAVVTFNVGSFIKLPKDTSAEIVSDGFLGNKYLALVPGGADEIIPFGGEIVHTQSSISLEAMIGQVIFSKPKGKSKKK